MREVAYVEEGKSNKEFVCSREKANVFLIGDSIRVGYCESTRKELSDCAEVFFVNDNCRNTQYVITSLLAWKNKFNDTNLVNVVHFNCGHWDIAHWSGHSEPLTSEEEYAKNIQIIIDLIRARFKNAKIAFATTTSMNPDGTPSGNYRNNDMIDRYNEIAVRVAEKNGIPVDDLNKITKEWGSDSYKDYCHHTEEAAAKLGKAVADFIREML